MATEDLRIYQKGGFRNYATYPTLGSKILNVGEVLHFNNIITGQVDTGYSVVGDGSTVINGLPFREIVKVNSAVGVTITPFRIAGNMFLIKNTDTGDINITTGGTPATIPVSSGRSVLLEFSGTEWNEIINHDFLFETATATGNVSGDKERLIETITRQAGDITRTLPDATTIKGRELILKVIGGAAGNVILAGTGAQTINGILIGSWIFQGAGMLHLISDGSDYIAINEIWDAGEDSGNAWYKNTKSHLIQDVKFTLTWASNSSIESIVTTFPLSFIDTNYMIQPETLDIGKMTNLSSSKRLAMTHPKSLIVRAVNSATVRVENSASAFTGGDEAMDLLTKICGKWA